MIEKSAIMLSKSAAIHDSKSARLKFLSTENTEISRFFKSAFAICTYFFNPLSVHSRKFPLVPKGST